MVERLFRDLSESQLQRDFVHRVAELVQTIELYVKQHHRDPKPFSWTARVSDILAK